MWILTATFCSRHWLSSALLSCATTVSTSVLIACGATLNLCWTVGWWESSQLGLPSSSHFHFSLAISSLPIPPTCWWVCVMISHRHHWIWCLWIIFYPLHLPYNDLYCVYSIASPFNNGNIVSTIRIFWYKYSLCWECTVAKLLEDQSVSEYNIIWYNLLYIFSTGSAVLLHCLYHECCWRSHGHWHLQWLWRRWNYQGWHGNGGKLMNSLCNYGFSCTENIVYI